MKSRTGFDIRLHPDTKEKSWVRNQSGVKTKSLSSPQECRNDYWCRAGIGGRQRARSRETPLPQSRSPVSHSPPLGVWVVAAVAADLDLQRRQVVQAALLHLVAETFLLLLDHCAPHLLQGGVVLLFCSLLSFLSVTSSPLGGRGRWWRRVAARRVAARLALLTYAALIVAGAESAPQATCRRKIIMSQVKTCKPCRGGKCPSSWLTFLSVFGGGGVKSSTVLTGHTQSAMHISGWLSHWRRFSGWGGGGRASPVWRVAPFSETLPHIYKKSRSKLRVTCLQQQKRFWLCCSTAHLSCHWRPQGGAVCAVHVFFPPAAVWRLSPWWVTVIWVWFLMLLLRFYSCSNDSKHVFEHEG